MARDISRDVVRGLNSLEMNFVNISGLEWTAHSGYVGQITYADTIFPCFAFLSGMSRTPYYRNVKLIGVGSGLNALSAIAGQKEHVRIPGVLQRLGTASMIANEPELSYLQKWCGAPLVAVWYAVTILGAAATHSENPLAHPDHLPSSPEGTAQTRLDRLAFGKRIYRDAFDPEGLLGGLTTAVTMLLGRWFSETTTFSEGEKALTGAALIGTGEALHYAFPKYAPISKSLWTPSFTLVTAGTSMLKYLAVSRAVPYLPAAVLGPLQAVGKRSLESYIFSSILSMIVMYGGDKKSLWSRGMKQLQKVTSQPVADFILSLATSGAVALFAEFLVSQNLRLRL